MRLLRCCSGLSSAYWVPKNAAPADYLLLPSSLSCERNLRNALASRGEQDHLAKLVDVFEQHGWQMKIETLTGDKAADVVISRDSLSYLLKLKVSSEGRRDRLVPLLSQVILQARARAKALPTPTEPLPLVAAPQISRSVAEELVSFLDEVAPNCAVGILDGEGFRHFVGPGLEQLNAAPPRPSRRQKLRTAGSAYLFSDLNQWMLKVLIAPLVPEGLLEAPRQEYRSASELALAAEVSPMSAYRFVRQLRQEGFLDSYSESLRLVRREELMRVWRAAHLRSVPELPLRWTIRDIQTYPLQVSLRAYHAKFDLGLPRACLGLFGAAETLGLDGPRELPPLFYLENLDRAVLSGLGLSLEDAEFRPDVYVRVPPFREAVFRAAVVRDGLKVADIIQVWLDIGSQTAHRDALSKEIRHGALAPVFDE